MEDSSKHLRKTKESVSDTAAPNLHYESVVLEAAYEKVSKKEYLQAANLFEEVLNKFALVITNDQRSIIDAELARIFLWLGNYDRAEFHAQAAIKARADNEAAMAILGKIAVAEYKFPQARGYFSKLSEENPDKSMGLCLISIRLRDTKGALYFIKEAAKYTHRSNPEYRILAAYCRLLSGNAASSVTEVREIVEEVGHDPLLLLFISEIFMNAGSYGEAEAVAKKVQDSCPKNDQMYAIHAHARYIDEEFDQSEHYARLSIGTNPRNAYAKTVLMKLATRVGNYSRAENIGKEILEQAPEYSLAHANLGDVYFNEGRYGLAEIEYEQTMELMNADTKGARLRTARMKFIGEDFLEASEILEKLISSHHTYYDDAMCDLALCYEKLDNLSKKEEVMDKMEMRRSFYHRTEKLLRDFKN